MGVPLLRTDTDPSALSDPADLIDSVVRREGGELDLMTLGSMLSADLGVQQYDALRNGRKLKKFVEDLGFTPVLHGAHLVIRARSQLPSDTQDE